MAKDYYVVDADGHVICQIDDWEKALPEPYKAVAPKKVFIGNKAPLWFIEGKIWPKQSGRGVGTPTAFRDKVMAGSSRGQQDPHARIPDMDLQGDNVAALFGALPDSSTSYLENAGLATAMATVYNDWLAEYCASYPERLKGIAVVAPQNPEGAAKELRRAVTKHGFVGAVIPPHSQGKNLDHPAFHPLYAEAERLGVPVTVHWGTSRNDDYAAGNLQFDNYFFAHAMAHPYQAGIAAISLVCGGMMEKFPKLKVAIMEAGAGWLPFWLGRFDEHFELMPEFVPIKHKPSDYFKGENFFISCEPEEETLPYVMDYLGDDHVVYASDYNHFDCTFPNSVKLITARKDLSDSQKRKILGDNAARMYGLKVPAVR